MNTLTLVENFRSHILGIPEVIATVAGKVYFGVIPTDVEVPAMTLTPSGGESQPFYRGSFGLSSVTVQVGIYSRSVSDLLTIFDALNLELNGYSGLLNSNSDALAQQVIVNPMVSLPQEDGINGLVFDVQITYDGGP